MSLSLSDERLDFGTTFEQYRCMQKDCKHRGPAVIVSVIHEHHPYGMGYATETLIDRIECERCGGSDLAEIAD